MFFSLLHAFVTFLFFFLSFFLFFFFISPPLASPNTISSLHFSSLYDLLYPPYLLIYILFLISGR